MIVVRERMPLRLAANIVAPDGYTTYRWGVDEPHPENVIGGLSFGDTMPGGFEQLTGTLTRNPEVDYPDLGEFSTLTVRGVSGAVAWEGRLEQTPRTSGDQMAITPNAVGWQAALEDNKTIKAIYVDCDLTRWSGASVQRKIDLDGGGIDADDPSTATDPSSGYPSLVTAIGSTWSRSHRCEAWYDGNGVALGWLYYAWKKDSQINAVDGQWVWAPYLCTDDRTPMDSPGSLRAAGPGSGIIQAAAGDRMSALVYMGYTVAGGGNNYPIYWTRLAVYGNYNLTLRGTGDYQNAPGLWAVDIINHAVSTWAPKLATSWAGASTITSSSQFVIPHLSFPEATSVAEIVKQATRFDLQDWAVWEGPTFWMADYGTGGRKWRARVGPAKLQATGRQVDRIWNSVVVQYQDVGVSRTVGPAGTGANTEDASLVDGDPANPANQAGLTRRALLQMGASSPSGAVKIGQAFLAQQKRLSTAGQATLTGYVEDANNGTLWPAWMVRSGDQICFVDAHDPSYRRVVKKTWDDNTKTAQVDLDSPPQGLDALLARLSVALTPLGFT